jgi:hypothetical protein
VDVAIERRDVGEGGIGFKGKDEGEVLEKFAAPAYCGSNGVVEVTGEAEGTGELAGEVEIVGEGAGAGDDRCRGAGKGSGEGFSEKAAEERGKGKAEDEDGLI